MRAEEPTVLPTARPTGKLGDVPDNPYTIPNALCIVRICATPVIGWLVVSHSFAPACGLFVLAGLTDMIDGQIARRFPTQRSMLGTMLDPVADKFLISTLFVTLAYVHLIPLSLTAIVFVRDFLLLGGAFRHRFRTLQPPRTFRRYFNPSVSSIEIRPTFASKLNTVLQLATVTLSMGITTVYSGWQYIGGRAIKAVKKVD
ncbi:putative cardiolipin synthase [Aphelenchoides fujianensis]|nr:putative cardiolipin synthase [Aphelenchoides fujianensis]